MGASDAIVHKDKYYGRYSLYCKYVLDALSDCTVFSSGMYISGLPANEDETESFI